MKTLTKILSVTALVVLCVCLFTLTAFAHSDPADCRTYSTEHGGAFVAGAHSGITPTCIEAGYSTYYVCADPNCKLCFDGSDPSSASYLGTESSLVKKDPTNHPGSLVKTDKVDETCTTPGVEEYYTCPFCNKLFSDSAGANPISAPVAIPATGHTVTTWVDQEDATCYSVGVRKHGICDDCKALVDSGLKTTTMNALIIPIDETAHTWSAWEVIKAPTDVSPGQQKRTCSTCGKVDYEEIPALGIKPEDGGQDIDYVIPIRDTWLRGEEPLTFESSLVKRLNDESGSSANYVGVRIGTDSLYENSFGTFDFWSWDQYVKLGDKLMASLREGTYRLWIYDVRNPNQYTCSCTFYVVDVPTLEAYSTDKHVVNSSKSLRFVASEEIDPNSVMVGSKKLYDSNDFFVSNDRKNITLSADFLNNRQTGTYTISAVTKGGKTIKTNFYILTTAQASSSPRTGDESQIGLWAAFLLLSGAAVVVLVPKLRKQGVK